MLSAEIATTLGGRYIVQNVYPFSFSEFLKASKIEIGPTWYYKNRTEIVRTFSDYFSYGGLPELMLIETIEKRQWLSNLFNKIFFGDLITRYSIRNDLAMKVLIRKLAESVKQPSSFNRLTNIVSTTGAKVSTDTIIDYLNFLQATWLFFSLENYASKLVEKISNRKYYFIDNGLLNLFLIDPVTSLLENIVAISLKKKYEEELYFYQQNIEVDFYIPTAKLAVQVSYSLKEESTRKRETDALLKIAETQAVETLLVITYDEEETIQKRHGDKSYPHLEMAAGYIILKPNIQPFMEHPFPNSNTAPSVAPCILKSTMKSPNVVPTVNSSITSTRLPPPWH